MTFQTVPFNIAGGTYQSRSRPLTSQRTVNFYQQYSDQGKDKFVLHSFPGLKKISESISGSDRGMHQMAEVQYRVNGERLYKTTDAIIHDKIGTIEGVNRCIFADDGENLVIVADEKVYIYNSFTGNLAESTNANLVDVQSVTVINSQFIYTTPDLSYMSQPGLPDDVSGLDAIGAESNPDKLVRDYAFNQTIYRFGTRTTEPWYNSGVGQPPIERIEGAQFSVGLGAIYSTAHTDNALYWLGNDKCIYRVAGNIKERVSSPELSDTLEKMSKVDDAYAYTFTLQGQDFYLITFPTGNRTFVLNEALGVNGWFELSSGNQNNAYTATSLLEIYNKNILAIEGGLYELDIDTYTQNNETMIRERITQEINSDALGVKHQRVKMSRLELVVEAGTGLIDGQGERPRILVETSIDGGRSYAHSAWIELGRLGEHTKRVELYQMVSGMGFIFRFTVSDPVSVSIYSAAIDMKVVGR